MFRVVHRQGAGGGAAVEATPTEGEDQSCYRAVVLPVAGERDGGGGGSEPRASPRCLLQELMLCLFHNVSGLVSESIDEDTIRLTLQGQVGDILYQKTPVKLKK